MGLVFGVLLVYLAVKIIQFILGAGMWSIGTIYESIHKRYPSQAEAVKEVVKVTIAVLILIIFISFFF